MPEPTEWDADQTRTAVFLPGPAHSGHAHRHVRQPPWAQWAAVAAVMAIYLSMPVLAYQVSGSSLWTALVVAAGALPHLAGPPLRDAVAGLADRRKALTGADSGWRVLVAVDGANAAVLASVAVAFSVDALTAPHVLVAAFAAQALFVCFDAAEGIRDRGGRPLFRDGPLAVRVAPVAGAALLLFTAVPPLLTVDGVSLVVSGLVVRAIVTWSGRTAATPSPPPGLGRGLRRRLTDLRGRRTDRVPAGVCGLHAAAGGAFLGQFVPWLDQSLGVPPVRDARLGLLLAVWAAGAAAAPAVLPRVAARLAHAGRLPPNAADRLVRTGVLSRRAADQLVDTGVLARVAGRLGGHRVTPVFLPVSALCLLLCSLAPHWTVAVLALAASGIAYMMVVLEERVSSGGLRMLAYGLGWPAGALAGGLVAAADGPRLGLACAAVLGVAATAVAWLSRGPGNA